MPSPRDIARAQALGRAVVGAALTFAPRRSSALWLGARAARRPQTAVMTAAMGARDLGIGVGAARAIGEGHGAGPWLAAGVLADATDLVVTWRSRDDLPALGVGVLVLVAGGSTLAGLWLRREVG